MSRKRGSVARRAICMRFDRRSTDMTFARAQQVQRVALPVACGARADLQQKDGLGGFAAVVLTVERTAANNARTIV
jgi:hypothetical protein